MRIPLIAGNWKMFKTKAQAVKTAGLLFGFFICLMAVPAIFLAEPVNADTDTVRIWDHHTDEHRMNASLNVGESTGYVLWYKLDAGIEENSHSWSVDDDSVCQIAVSGNRVSVSIRKEGMTRVRLQVKAKDGNTYSDYFVVSVITPMTEAGGRTIRSTMITRAAHFILQVRP